MFNAEVFHFQHAMFVIDFNFDDIDIGISTNTMCAPCNFRIKKGQNKTN